MLEPGIQTMRSKTSKNVWNWINHLQRVCSTIWSNWIRKLSLTKWKQNYDIKTYSPRIKCCHFKVTFLRALSWYCCVYVVYFSHGFSGLWFFLNDCNFTSFICSVCVIVTYILINLEWNWPIKKNHIRHYKQLFLLLSFLFRFNYSSFSALMYYTVWIVYEFWMTVNKIQMNH